MFMTKKRNDIAEKFDKSLEKVRKSEKTLERHYKTLAKRIKQIETFGIKVQPLVNMIDFSKTYSDLTFTKMLKIFDSSYFQSLFEQHRGTTLFSDVFDLTLSLEAINATNKKIAEAKRISDSWQVKLQAEDAYIQQVNDLPQSVHDLLKACSEYTAAHFRTVSNLPDSFIDELVQSAIENIYKDFVFSVLPITGNLYEAVDVSVGKKGELNGLFIGEEGAARVETIGAGGYNIQKFHYRTLVYRYKQEVVS